MKPKAVKVPAPLLLDRCLTSSAKLLWIITQLDAPGDRSPVSAGLLGKRSGLARHTIARGLAQLESTGWLSATPKGAQPTTPKAGNTASLPSDLLLDRRLGAPAKLLYGSLQLTPGFQYPTGQVTYPDLGGLTGLSPKWARALIQELQGQGWLTVAQPTKFSPIHFTLRNPLADLREGDVTLARLRLEEASFRGETVMREYLSLIVESDEFEDNATPGFLVNPYTGEELQFDRYYPPRVAFEFNGAQHYGPTALYAKESDMRRLQARDLIKIGVCVRRSITLVVVHPEDLTLAVMQQKVSGLLPMRNLDGHEPLSAYLAAVSRGYRRKAGPKRGGDR